MKATFAEARAQVNTADHNVLIREDVFFLLKKITLAPITEPQNREEIDEVDEYFRYDFIPISQGAYSWGRLWEEDKARLGVMYDFFMVLDGLEVDIIDPQRTFLHTKRKDRKSRLTQKEVGGLHLIGLGDATIDYHFLISKETNEKVKNYLQEFLKQYEKQKTQMWDYYPYKAQKEIFIPKLLEFKKRMGNQTAFSITKEDLVGDDHENHHRLLEFLCILENHGALKIRELEIVGTGNDPRGLIYLYDVSDARLNSLIKNASSVSKHNNEPHAFTAIKSASLEEGRHYIEINKGGKIISFKPRKRSGSVDGETKMFSVLKQLWKCKLLKRSGVVEAEGRAIPSSELLRLTGCASKNALEQQITRLNKKFEHEGVAIRIEPAGNGYRLVVNGV